MCLILFAWQAHPRYPLIVAANRDEFHDRPTAEAMFWSDEPDFLTGRDLQVADVILNNLEAPGWVFRVLLSVLLLGLPAVALVSWVFDWTPAGLKRTDDLDDEGAGGAAKDAQYRRALRLRSCPSST